MDKIPITQPFLGEEEAAAAREVILSGWVTQGPRVKQFEEDFAAYVGAKHACAASSCTTALYLALLVVGVSPGDVVITVSHSFIATANAVRYCSAEPVFIDIDLATYNMSPSKLEECLFNECEKKDGLLWYKKIHNLAFDQSPLCHVNEPHGRVAAILPVHQMGMPCDLKKILQLAGEFNIPVVEDAACAIGSEISFDEGRTWKKIGKPHGDITCFSFHPRKVITTGDGGMLTTNNDAYDKQFRLLRQHGMSISDIDRHGANKIIFEDYIIHGYNFRMTDIQAAVGIEQIKKLSFIVDQRRKLANEYTSMLQKLEWIIPPYEPKYAKANYQSYPIRLKDISPIDRDRLMHYLLERGISTRRGIMNAHQEIPYDSKNFILPHSEIARDSSLLLPLFPGCDIRSVANALLKYN